ncbi:MAG: universal stress protein [Nitrososphaera sp.]|uniref:universal stress protein n=1 Tax=Nitrososphaera sp. TaxID=1971748 RepID=UPI003D6FC9B8
MQVDGIKRVVVAVDLSMEHAKRCIQFASQLANATGCETIVLTVIENSKIVDTEGRVDYLKLQRMEGEAKSVHEALVVNSNLFTFQNMIKSEFLKSDDIADAICEYCGNVDADLVIVGRRGIGFLKEVLLGSVSEKVLKNSPCSVMVVK